MTRRQYWKKTFVTEFRVPVSCAHQPVHNSVCLQLECGQSTYLRRQVSFVYCESRMAEEQVQSMGYRNPGGVKHLERMNQMMFKVKFSGDVLV